MNMGQVAVIGLFVVSAAAGYGIWYTNTQAYWAPVEGVEIVATPLSGGAAENFGVTDVTAVRSDSSPLGFRACFTTTASPALMSETYIGVERASPTIAPPQFACFDAAAIGAALESGEALAFLGQENVAFGVDRIVAILPDGRGFAWHELNNCGKKSYDGSVIGDACPDRATFQGSF
jgi:hypothetical protein